MSAYYKNKNENRGKKCSVGSCNRKARKKGMCDSCYHKFYYRKKEVEEGKNVWKCRERNEEIGKASNEQT